MFIEFSVANFRSFRDKQTLSMAATSSKELSHQTFSPDVPGVPDLVRSAVVYGPNAAGKSNLVQAFHLMRDCVLNSSKGKQLGENIKVSPFRFVKQLVDEPSEFEVIFVWKRVHYQYGFAATHERVREEWLYVYPEGRRQIWFERNYEKNTGKNRWYFGSKFKGSKEVWRKATRANALFLSTAVQLNSESLKPIFFWFQDHLKFVFPSDYPDSRISTLRMCEKVEGKEAVLKFLNAADFSIRNIEIKKKRLTEKDLHGFSESMQAELKGLEIFDVKMLHRAPNEDMAVMDIGEESRGTQKMLEHAGTWLDVLEKGVTLVVDELDNSLHVHILRYLLGLFHDTNSSPNQAQLLFTTHNTSLMQPDLFRRDQIWFVERDRGFASRLYPLTDFKPRKGEALEKGYLRGRYGALPFIGELAF